MQQEIYFPEWPSLTAIEETYTVSSFMLVAGIVIFSLIILIAVVSLVRIFIRIRRVKQDQKNIYVDMELFYKKQMKLLHGKAFLSSFYQYSKLLVQLGRWKTLKEIWHNLWFTDAMVEYIQQTINEGKELDYEFEKRIKEILHQHIAS